MIGASCLTNIPFQTTKICFMYSDDIQTNCFKNNCADLWKSSYYINENSMKGYTLLYNGRTSNTALNRQQLDNLDRLYDIEQLEENWNGHGGKPISKNVITKSREIILNIIRQPQVYPTGRATVHMQYELDDRSYLEFEIFDDKIVYMVVPQRVYANAKVEKMEKLDMSIINTVVGDFYGKIITKERNALSGH